MQRFLFTCLLLCAGRAHAEDNLRPFVFSLDGNTIAKRRIALESGVGYNGVTDLGGGLQPDDARHVAVWLAGQVGITDRVEIGAAFQFGDAPDLTFGFNQARIDLRVRVLGPFKKAPIWVTLGLGYQADALLQHAITATLAATARLGRFNLTFNLRAAHYFHAGRDPIDIFVTAGALVRATRWLSVGAEYVGEELEGVGDEDEAELGAAGGRHYVGPTVVFPILDGRLRLNLTGGAIITGAEVGPMLRGSVAYLF